MKLTGTMKLGVKNEYKQVAKKPMQCSPFCEFLHKIAITKIKIAIEAESV